MIFLTGWNTVKVIVMYLRQLFSDRKIKLVYSNGPSQVDLSCPFKDVAIEQRTKMFKIVNRATKECTLVT